MTTIKKIKIPKIKLKNEIDWDLFHDTFEAADIVVNRIKDQTDIDQLLAYLDSRLDESKIIHALNNHPKFESMKRSNQFAFEKKKPKGTRIERKVRVHSHRKNDKSTEKHLQKMLPLFYHEHERTEIK